MIVVDSSVWIDYFNGTSTPGADTLDGLLGTEEMLLGDLIVAEVLQGFRSDSDFRTAQRVLSRFEIAAMLGPTAAMRSAENYRALRARGVTVRKTVDVLIGTFCIDHGHSLLFSDRDFLPMVEHLGLVQV